MSGGKYPTGAAPIQRDGSSHVDLLVIGAGSATEELCTALAEASGGKVPFAVGVVERSLVGGECPYLACMPSKAMLRSAALRREIGLAASLGAVGETPVLSDETDAFQRSVRRRDLVAEGRDDSEHVRELAEIGVEVLRGEGRLVAHKRAEVIGVGGESREVTFERLVIATGSINAPPPVEGLKTPEVWTSDHALSNKERPSSLLIVGGGPIGCELAEVYAAFGTEVTLIESVERLISREDSACSQAVRENLESSGVRVLTGVRLSSAEVEAGKAALNFEDGTTTRGERVLVAAGRRPATGHLGLESAGIELSEDGFLPVTSRLEVRGTDAVFAIGDVTSIAPFTHAAKQQARALAANLLGGDERAESEAIPRSVFTDPPLFAVGLTAEEAAKRGLDPLRVEFDVSETARAEVDGHSVSPVGGDEGKGLSKKAVLVLVVGRERRRVLGAAAVAPHADEWMNEVSLALSGGLSIEALARVVHPFPTYSEALEQVYRQALGAL